MTVRVLMRRNMWLLWRVTYFGEAELGFLECPETFCVFSGLLIVIENVSRWSYRRFWRRFWWWFWWRRSKASQDYRWVSGYSWWISSIQYVLWGMDSFI